MDGSTCQRTSPRRFVTAALAAALAAVACLPAGTAGAAAFPPSEQVFPATTRGWVSISHGPEFRQRFDRSSYGQLLKDPAMKPFIESVRKEIGESNRGRLGRLALSLDDLLEVAGGEYTVGGVESPGGKLVTVVLVDTTGREVKARELLDTMNRRMAEQKATKVAAPAGSPLTVYQLPPAANGTGADQRVAFAQVGAALVVGDDPALVSQMIGTLAQGRGDCLGSVAGFGAVMGRCQPQVPAKAATVRWYVDPLPFAKAYQATNPPREKRKGPDYVAILGRQGFDCVKGAGGVVVFDDGGHSMRHHTMVYAPPLPGRQPFAADRFDLAARMLQFPDVDRLAPQPWVPKGVSGWTALQFDLRNAFVSVESLVDDIVGEKGVYDDVIASVKEDPDGPQIDVEQDLVAALGTRVSLITDHADPADPDAERLVVAIETVDEARVAATIAKVMNADKDMERKEIAGHTVWELIDRTAAIPELQVETPVDLTPTF